MREFYQKQAELVCLIDVEQLIAPDHRIHVLGKVVDKMLGQMDEHFEQNYSKEGAAPVPPETLSNGKLLQALY